MVAFLITCETEDLIKNAYCIIGISTAEEMVKTGKEREW